MGVKEGGGGREGTSKARRGDRESDTSSLQEVEPHEEGGGRADAWQGRKQHEVRRA